MKPGLVVAAAAVVMLGGCEADGPEHVTSDSVHAFYYGWYANDETDGFTAHWNHDVLGVDYSAGFPGDDDIGANYYPELGTYSSNDTVAVGVHLKQCADAGIGVLVVSWWGDGTFEDLAVPRLLDLAHRQGVKIAFHLEPFSGRNAETSREAIVHLLEHYGRHPAIYRAREYGSRPVVYVYDSYLTEASEWRRLWHPEGDITIRGTSHDVVAIGLWVNENDGDFFVTSCFDGFYTYFASDGFTYGSAVENWPKLAEWASEHGKIFIPSIGPGYIDTRIRPWNSSTTRSREDGGYYDRCFEAAIRVDPAVVSITSFNEWHEGTQIEPAQPKSIDGYAYEDYAPLAPDYYLMRTRHWVDAFVRARE